MLICTDHIYDSSSWEPRTINFADTRETRIDRICSWCHDGCAFILDGVAVGSKLRVGRSVEGKRCRMRCGEWCGKRGRARGSRVCDVGYRTTGAALGFRCGIGVLGFGARTAALLGRGGRRGGIGSVVSIVEGNDQ